MALTMVLGYDGSDCAMKALGHAAGVARAAGGAHVIVVHAYEFSIGYVPTGMTDSPLMMTAEYGDHIELLRQHGDDLVAAAAQELEAAGAQVERVVANDSPVEALLEAARKHAADFIVVGSHGEGALSAAFLGSTAMRLLHHSEVPVLVVPRHRK